MKKFAVINSENTVTNVVVGTLDENLYGLWIDIDTVSPSPGIGWSYINGSFVEPTVVTPSLPSWSDPNLDPMYHWIDVGPFFDRFGAKALSITGSTDPQVQGLITLLLPRKYVDLKRVDLPSLLDLLVSKSLITPSEKTSILNPQTNEYERHVKGLVQPV